MHFLLSSVKLSSLIYHLRRAGSPRTRTFLHPAGNVIPIRAVRDPTGKVVAAVPAPMHGLVPGRV